MTGQENRGFYHFLRKGSCMKQQQNKVPCNKVVVEILTNILQSNHVVLGVYCIYRACLEQIHGIDVGLFGIWLPKLTLEQTKCWRIYLLQLLNCDLFWILGGCRSCCCCCQGKVDSVKINPSLLMTREPALLLYERLFGLKVMMLLLLQGKSCTIAAPGGEVSF